MSWSVANRGQLQTVRFDDADALDVNMTVSSGVLGSRRTNGSLYVALDSAVQNAVVSLRTADAPAPEPEPSAAMSGSQTSPSASPIASLVSSRWLFSNRIALPCGFELTAQGYGPGQMQWQTVAGKSFSISASRGSTVLWREVARAGADGMLKLQAPPIALEPLALRFDCQ
jgi:hypothetical protein